MAAKAHKKKSYQYKKSRLKAQERFAKKFPYRLSWMTEPNTEFLQPWEVRSNSLREGLPLQKKLLPTRSIPMPGLGAPERSLPSNHCPPPPPPPPPALRNLWELKLLSLRFPRQAEHHLTMLQNETDDPLV